MANTDFKKSVQQLEKVLKQKEMDDVIFDAVCKRFEVCFEYCWKHFKMMATQAGQEVYSPRDAIREALKMHVISDEASWMKYLQERNLSVHNYYSGDPQDTLKIIRSFLKEVRRIAK